MRDDFFRRAELRQGGVALTGITGWLKSCEKSESGWGVGIAPVPQLGRGEQLAPLVRGVAVVRVLPSAATAKAQEE